jgi:hypothetical protein
MYSLRIYYASGRPTNIHWADRDIVRKYHVRSIIVPGLLDILMEILA